MPIPGAPSNTGDGLSRLSTAVDQHNQGVTGDQTSPWTRAANTPNAMLGVGQQYAHSVGQTVGAWKNLTAPATPGGPPPTAGQVTARAIRATQQTVGAVMGGFALIKSALDVGFANLTAPIAAVFPSLPAATITSAYIGTPHAHPTHPPSGPPPVPPTPMPSIGMVTLGVSVRVLINSMPAARVDDIGLAPTCCGLPVAWFKIKTGSSNVFIGGVRAARLMDVCKACPMIPETPSASAGKAMAAIGKAANVASKVMQYGGFAAGALQYAADMSEATVEDDAALAAGKALDAATTAAQMAMDIAKMAVEAMMWKDVPVIPPTGSIGAIVDPSHVNVLIGGFPMINIPDPVSALLNRLSRYKAASPPENEGCGEEGEPVNVVSGANLEASIDFPLSTGLNLAWRRYYDSSQREVRGPLGWGWRHEFERTLRFDVDGIIYLPANGPSVAFSALKKNGTSTASSGFLLRRINDTAYQLQRGGEPIWEFAISMGTTIGQLRQIFDKNFSVRFAYDRANRLTNIQRSDNNVIALEYDSRGLLIRMVELDEKSGSKPILAYQYNRNEDLVTWTDVFNARATLEYDDQHRLTRKGDRRNYSYHYAYDSLSRCVHTWGEDGLYDVHLAYFPELRCTKATHSDAGVWTFFYDENGTITRILDPYGKARERIVNTSGKVVSEIDSCHNVYNLLYDANGSLMGRRDPFGHVSRNLIDRRRHNHLALVAPATPVEWEFGSLLLPEDIRAIGPKNDPVYDALGRKIEEMLGDGIRRHWTHDGNGNVLTHTDADGSTRHFKYTSWNLLYQEIDPLGSATEYSYTPREQIRRVIDPGKTSSEYVYDLRDNIVRVRRNGEMREEYVRDSTDNLIEKRDRSGKTIVSFEIGPGNLTTVRRLASGENHYFGYDAGARLTRAATDSHETLFEYGFGPRPLSDQRNGVGIRHESENAGLRKSVVFNRFRTQYRSLHYGAAITDPTGARHKIVAYSGGRIVLELAHGITETSQYDANGRCLSKERSSLGYKRHWVRQYSYSPEGDLLAIRDNRFGNQRFEYDVAHRLVLGIGIHGTPAEYRYDAAGNLIAKPGLSEVVIAPGNRLASANRLSFLYNERDHVASYSDGTRTVRFDYDSCDRLVRAVTPSGEWHSAYDPLGRRILKSWNGLTTEYFWDDSRLAAEKAHDGRLRIYIYSDLDALVPFMFLDYESIDAPIGSCRRYFISSNQIGTPILIDDQEGEIVWRAEVDPYGVTQVDRGKKIDFTLRFPGHQEDREIELFYNRFRHYSPILGRYLQSDPMGIAGGINLYAYSANPLTQVDLFGLNHPPKKDDPDGSKKTGADKEETREEKMARLKQERDARIREQSREDALQAAIQKADASGKQDALTPDERAWLNSDPRNKILAIDPDGSGGYRVAEAQAALQAEQDGTLASPVRRATEKANPGEAGADFVDGNNQTWDHKDASHGADNIAATANPPNKENVLVDSRNQSQPEQQALENDVNSKLDPDESKRGQVVFVPKR